MLAELQTLQDLIRELGQKHTQTKKELNEFKTKPMVEASALDALKQAHSKDKTELVSLRKHFDNLNLEMAQLKKQLESKTAECEGLANDVARLTADNNELLAKNEISSQRAQTILQRLAALDHADY